MLLVFDGIEQIPRLVTAHSPGRALIVARLSDLLARGGGPRRPVSLLVTRLTPLLLRRTVLRGLRKWRSLTVLSGIGLPLSTGITRLRLRLSLLRALRLWTRFVLTRLRFGLRPLWLILRILRLALPGRGFRRILRL